LDGLVIGEFEKESEELDGGEGGVAGVVDGLDDFGVDGFEEGVGGSGEFEEVV
jgi:hypothetical protein